MKQEKNITLKSTAQAYDPLLYFWVHFLIIPFSYFFFFKHNCNYGGLKIC